MHEARERASRIVMADDLNGASSCSDSVPRRGWCSPAANRRRRWRSHHGHDGEDHGHDERGEHGHHPHRRGQPADRPDPRRPEGRDLLPEIEPIVICLQENHSYDSYFGMFPKGDGYRVRRGVATNSNVDAEGRVVPVTHAQDTCQSGRGVSQNWVSTHRPINGGQMDCTEENPSDIQLGEAFSSSVINAVMASPAWPKTVLLFMYDV